MANRIKKIGPFTETVATQFSRPEEMFVPGWDKRAGAEQAMTRVATRARMGQKLTPPGCGVMDCKPRRQE